MYWTWRKLSLTSDQTFPPLSRIKKKSSGGWKWKQVAFSPRSTSCHTQWGSWSLCANKAQTPFQPWIWVKQTLSHNKQTKAHCCGACELNEELLLTRQVSLKTCWFLFLPQTSVCVFLCRQTCGFTRRAPQKDSVSRRTGQRVVALFQRLDDSQKTNQGWWHFRALIHRIRGKESPAGI